MANNASMSLSSADLSRYRSTLLELARRLGQDTSSIEEQARGAAGGQGSGELSNAPLHLGDAGSEEYMHDMNATLLENEEYLSVEVMEALDRLADGSFGQCEECQVLIPSERLDAMPYTRYCVACSEKVGGGLQVNFNSGRPRTASELAPEREEDPAERLLTSAKGQKRKPSKFDSHAAGTPGGGAADGGLAGSNVGRGEPQLNQLDRASGSGDVDTEREDSEDEAPQSGSTGGAVGGTPAGKRAKRK